MPYEDYRDALWYDLHTAFADDISKHVTKETVGRLSDGQPDYLEKMVSDMLDSAPTPQARRDLLTMATERLLDSSQADYERALVGWDQLVNRRWAGFQARLRAEEEAKKKAKEKAEKNAED